MRILHLAYEDPAQPGSGGGSTRTWEINRRLAERHDITLLVAGYPGAKPRMEGGMHWIPVGTRTGSKLDRLSYFALLGPALRRHRFDLLVEDLSAPFSTAFSPLFTDKPVVASVQWLFAEEMREKYGLPFDVVERVGLRHYEDFIVVSNWLGERVRQRVPGSTVEVIPNGVEAAARVAGAAAPEHFLFVGRLDVRQKGCDLLLKSLHHARARTTRPLPPLLVVGDGRDQGELEEKARTLNLGDAVRFLGRVEGTEKFHLMSRAWAVLVPSRFETFGMVAVEAQAAGAPVIAFDVGPLREVAGGGGAILVPPFDTVAFAGAMLELLEDPMRREQVTRRGREWARQYDWDRIARLQEEHYLRAVEGTTGYTGG